MILRRQSSGRKSEENAKARSRNFWRRLSSFSRYYLLLGLSDSFKIRRVVTGYCLPSLPKILKFGEFLEKNVSRCPIATPSLRVSSILRSASTLPLAYLGGVKQNLPSPFWRGEIIGGTLA